MQIISIMTTSTKYPFNNCFPIYKKKIPFLPIEIALKGFELINHAGYKYFYYYRSLIPSRLLSLCLPLVLKSLIAKCNRWDPIKMLDYWKCWNAGQCVVLHYLIEKKKRTDMGTKRGKMLALVPPLHDNPFFFRTKPPYTSVTVWPYIHSINPVLIPIHNRSSSNF